MVIKGFVYNFMQCWNF